VGIHSLVLISSQFSLFVGSCNGCVVHADHYSDDLVVMLEDAMEQDFHARLEDGSPYEVIACPWAHDTLPLGVECDYASPYSSAVGWK
jgi:hypothetical protein